MSVLQHTPGTQRYDWYCAGCKCPHPIHLGITARTFNGDLEKPTFTPATSFLPERADEAPVCVAEITDGQVTYLPQCTHELTGQTVPMVAL